MVIYDSASDESRDESLGVNYHKQGTRHVSDQCVFGGVNEEQQMNVADFVAWPQTKASTASTVNAGKSECVSRGCKRDTRSADLVDRTWNWHYCICLSSPLMLVPQ